jgi:hypothetical protein
VVIETTGRRLAAAESRVSPYRVFGVMLLASLCAASIVIGWALMLASLLYVVSGLSATLFVLTAAALAAGHIALAMMCWHCAVALGRKERRALAEAMLAGAISGPRESIGSV